MTRKEALEYINNMWMSGETHDALEALIPEFGKAGSDKAIDHEDKYKEALLEARAVLEPCLKYSRGNVREALDSIDRELRSFEDEDERIRKLLIWQVHRNIEDETNDLAGSVYDGIKGHDPDLEESIEDWKKCLAYLEKQKEQEPVERSREGNYIIGFVYALLNQIEWKDNWAMSKDECLRRLNNYRPQKPTEWNANDKSFIKDCARILDENGYAASSERLLSMFPVKQEWSEDDKAIVGCIACYLDGQFIPEGARRQCQEWLNRHRRDFLNRPSWKPSEEQMKALEAATVRYQSTGLESLYEDLKKL